MNRAVAREQAGKSAEVRRRQEQQGVPQAASAPGLLPAVAHLEAEPSVASHLVPYPEAVRLPVVPSGASLPVLLRAVPSAASRPVPYPVAAHPLAASHLARLPVVPSVASHLVLLRAVHLPVVPSAASRRVPSPAAAHPVVVPSEAWRRVAPQQEVQLVALLVRVHHRRSAVGGHRAVGRIPAQPQVLAQVQAQARPAVGQRVPAPPVAVGQEQVLRAAVQWEPVPRGEVQRVRVASREVRQA